MANRSMPVPMFTDSVPQRTFFSRDASFIPSTTSLNRSRLMAVNHCQIFQSLSRPSWFVS